MTFQRLGLAEHMRNVLCRSGVNRLLWKHVRRTPRPRFPWPPEKRELEAYDWSPDSLIALQGKPRNLHLRIRSVGQG